MTMRPDQLLYHFPGIDRIRLARLAMRYHNERCTEALRGLAEGLGYVVLAGQDLNWRQKRNAAGRYHVGGRGFFLYRPGEAPEIKTCGPTG